MIGLKRGVVKLVPHNRKWARIFEKEKLLLKKTFGKIIIAIEHIGSTAIPNIPAKPIIDMNVAVKSLKTARGMKEKFEKLGYEYRPFQSGHTKEDLRAQELYVKGPAAKRTHHAHVTVYKKEYWNRDLIFRDYLQKNRSRAQQYANLKKKLAKRYPNNRTLYTKNKEKFISQTIKAARRK